MRQQRRLRAAVPRHRVELRVRVRQLHRLLEQVRHHLWLVGMHNTIIQEAVMELLRQHMHSELRLFAFM
jgi:hypothetical protein